MIKKVIFISILSVSLVGCTEKTDSIEDLKILGTKSFSKDVWAESSQEERALMVYSFIAQHDITVMAYDDVVNLLGKPTAYYNYDEYPAYFVGPKNIESEYGKGYVLAFPTDRKTNKVRRYIIVPQISLN